MKILDLTAPERSDIRYQRFSFPDGQPHFELPHPEDIGTLERVEVLCRIRSAADIVDVGLAMDVLLASSLAFDQISRSISLNVAYMLGARMDRRISPRHPFTLNVISDLLKVAAHGADRVRVLDPHSPETLRQLYDERDSESPMRAEAIPPDRLVKLALEHFGDDATIVIPDAGAVTRTTAIVERLGLKNAIARCVKKRDSATGKLSGFALEEGDVAGKDCLIVDDLCDGGGTFSGIAEVLRVAGAVGVSLCVTHGVFSRGFRIPGIDRTYCTDSFGVSDPVDWIGERGTQGPEHWVTYRKPGHVPACLYVLTDFVRDHVRGLEAP